MGRIADSYGLVMCANCSHHFLRATDSLKDELRTSYADDPSAFRPDPRFVQFAQRFVDAELRPRLKSHGRVLDFGCGKGEFLDVLRGSGYDGQGYDLSNGAVRFCVERGLRAEAGDFLSWSRPQGAPDFDLVTMWDVLEHLPDPLPYLIRIRALLGEGGRLFVKTPRVESLTIKCVRLIPWLAGPVLLAPGHLQYFRKESLGRLLERAGFRSLEWLPGRNIRTGTRFRLRSYVRHGVVHALQALSGDSNNLVFASA